MSAEEGAVGKTPWSRFGLEAPFGQLLFAWLITCAYLLSGLTFAIRIQFNSTDAQFLLRQDLLVLGLDIVIVGLLGAVPVALASQIAAWRSPPARGLVAALSALVFLGGAIGARLILRGYTLSLDEFLADFDAKIFASGRLVAPIAPEWRDYAAALQPMYTLQAPDHSFWASGYLPVNAGLRALGRLVHGEALVNPLLSAFGVAATWGVGRQLWPDRPTLALIAAALLATSAQLIVTAMTAYAMPAHLAFNMAWLWLFLRGGRLGHSGALVVGFFAVGIHQLAFHPMFVAPFILQLWLDRRWALAGLYTAAYAGFCLFWIAYPTIALALSGPNLTAHGGTGGVLFAEQVAAGFRRIGISNIGEIGLSLIRFVTWQNPLTAPLAGIGLFAAWRAPGHLRSLALGIVITLAAMLILVPSQTHGWGYRYLHGLLGSACLLAAWTWAQLTDPLPADRRAAATGGMVIACALSLFALAPLRTWQAWSYVRPYARADAAIQSARSEVVVIDSGGPLLFDSGTVTRNDPFLAHGPKVMALPVMDEALVRRLCAGGKTIEIFDGSDAKHFGLDTVPQPPDPDSAQLRTLMNLLKCGRPLS